MKKLFLITTLLISFNLWAETEDEKLIRKLLLAEIEIDKCIEAKDCSELVKNGGPLVSIITDTNLGDASFSTGLRFDIG